VKKVLCLLTAVLFVFISAACSEKFNLKTPVGTFNMTVAIADKYDTSVPAEGNQFLVVRLTPVSSDVSVKEMQEYFKPDDASAGAIAECGAGEYTFSSMHFEKDGDADICVIIFEIPKELTDSDKITLKLPK
jgi:hypothetical protein